MPRIKQTSFLEAKSNPELRQPYLDSIMSQCPESVEALVYDPEFTHRFSYADSLVVEGHLDGAELEREKPLMQITYFMVVYSPSRLGLGGKIPIFISNSGFDKMKDEPYFLNCVLDHEAVHTDDVMYGLRLHDGILIDHTNVDQLSPNTIIGLREIRAYRNQLNMLGKRGIKNSIFRDWITCNIDTYGKSLNSVVPKSELEKRVLKEVKL